jgi:hypothetical protein
MLPSKRVWVVEISLQFPINMAFVLFVFDCVGFLFFVFVFTEISTDLDERGVVKDPLWTRKAITTVLVQLGMIPAIPALARVAPPTHLTVLLDGRVVGYMETSAIPAAVAHIRHLKVAKVPAVRQFCILLESLVHKGSLS